MNWPWLWLCNCRKSVWGCKIKNHDIINMQAVKKIQLTLPKITLTHCRNMDYRLMQYNSLYICHDLEYSLCSHLKWMDRPHVQFVLCGSDYVHGGWLYSCVCLCIILSVVFDVVFLQWQQITEGQKEKTLRALKGNLT